MVFFVLSIQDNVKVDFCTNLPSYSWGLFSSLVGLYRGYKDRNARLDAVEAQQPSYLAASTTPLVNQTFSDVNSEDVLREIHDHLALKHALLDRVIRARKLHHSRFFSLNLDYGHQHYLDILSNRRFIVIRALERLERRVSEVLYDTQRWFKWVRECQDEEDAARENEKKKIKSEAALFKRHVKDVQARMRALRAREDLKQQEDYLEIAYNTRLSEEEQEAQWDPIEDVIKDERGNYIDLIKNILFLTESVDDAQGNHASGKGMQGWKEETSLSSNATKKAKKSKARTAPNGSSIPLPENLAHDTKSQLRHRLKEGVELSYGKGLKVAGTIDNPIETYKRTAPVPDDVIDQLLEQMTEIKHLLFCRLLLSHATVLPTAINANTVEEFLNDKDITDADLRDLVLRLDNPGLQEIRDACADFGREDEEDDDIYDEPDVEEEIDKREERLKKLNLTSTRRGNLPKSWAPRREKQVTKEQRERQSIVERSGALGVMPEEGKGQTMIDFGDVDNEVLIRDAKTSKILSSPPKNQCWLSREKAGLGRASKNEWIVKAEVGQAFFEKMETTRQWHFGFNEYYDVYVWDLEAGQPWPCLYNTVWETLVKAHRFRSIQDMYNPLAPILKTLTRDRVTFRTRDFKLGEDGRSLWDDVQSGQNRMVDPEGKTPEERLLPDLDVSHFYGEPDALEDEVLFQERLSTETATALYSGRTNALQDFVDSSPDFERFIYDLETDEELSSSDGSDYSPEDESEVYGSEEDELLENQEKVGESEQEENESLEETFDEESRSIDAVNRESTLPPLSKIELDDLALLAQIKLPNTSGDKMKEDFYRFMDREKSKAFKQGWHAADLNPGGPDRQHEAQVIREQMVKYNLSTSDRYKHYQTLQFLNVHPCRHRRILPDARDARAMVTLFFHSDFLSSEYGIMHKDSLLLKQKERALNPPPMRESASERHKSTDFWKDWDNHWKTHNRNAHYPVEWDVVIRPVIAKLYKAGIIKPTHLDSKHTFSRAMSAPGAEGKRDLFVDFRPIAENMVSPSYVQQPPSKDYLLSSIRRFSKNHAGARFAALRLWSAPHFYPLMNGLDKRHMTAFIDGLGRTWEWNFVPKDMPHSATSIHHTASQRISAFKAQFTDRVVHRGDLFIVMGSDAQDLLELTTAAIFAIQTEPWRFEVDLWRSFINVDQDFFNFLDELNAGWLD
ncbi:MAG: hypothetical protein Q9219_003240 [cf. Caloplaca sp. 3 TL-2023]